MVEHNWALEQAKKYRDSPTYSFMARSMSGANEGLLTGLHRYDKAEGGIDLNMYYLVGADSGVGKTTFVDWIAFYYPMLYHIIAKNPMSNGSKRKIKWIYYSFEIGEVKKEMQMISMLLNVFYGNHKSIKDMGKNAHKEINADTWDQIVSVKPMLEEIRKHVEFRWSPMSPHAMTMDVFKIAEKNGQIITDNDNRPIRYIPNDPDTQYIVIVDSMNLIARNANEGVMSEKDAMDNWSSSCVALRNLLPNFTFFNIQQFNNSLMSMNRMQLTGKGDTTQVSGIKPSKMDFGGSTYTYRDADYVIGGIKPFMFDIPYMEGFNILDKSKAAYGSYLTLWYFIKDRWGEGNLKLPIIRTTAAPILRLPPKPQEKIDMSKILDKQYRLEIPNLIV